MILHNIYIPFDRGPFEWQPAHSTPEQSELKEWTHFETSNFPQEKSICKGKTNARQAKKQTRTQKVGEESLKFKIKDRRIS